MIFLFRKSSVVLQPIDAFAIFRKAGDHDDLRRPSAQSHPWFQAALEEIAVGQIMGRLSPDWTVLHGLRRHAGTSDIAYVLIGMAKAFTLTTKNDSGKNVWVGGP